MYENGVKWVNVRQMFMLLLDTQLDNDDILIANEHGNLGIWAPQPDGRFKWKGFIDFFDEEIKLYDEGDDTET